MDLYKKYNYYYLNLFGGFFFKYYFYISKLQFYFNNKKGTLELKAIWVN